MKQILTATLALLFASFLAFTTVFAGEDKMKEEDIAESDIASEDVVGEEDIAEEDIAEEDGLL